MQNYIYLLISEILKTVGVEISMRLNKFVHSAKTHIRKCDIRYFIFFWAHVCVKLKWNNRICPNIIHHVYSGTGYIYVFCDVPYRANQKTWKMKKKKKTHKKIDFFIIIWLLSSGIRMNFWFFFHTDIYK